MSWRRFVGVMGGWHNVNSDWYGAVSDSGQHGAVVRQANDTEATAAPVQRDVDIRTLLRRSDAVLHRSLPWRRRQQQTDDVDRRPAAEQDPRRRLVRHTLLDIQQTRTV